MKKDCRFHDLKKKLEFRTLFEVWTWTAVTDRGQGSLSPRGMIDKKKKKLMQMIYSLNAKNINTHKFHQCNLRQRQK